MNENRTILGYITHAIEAKREIAFPEVKAWIKGPGEVIVRPSADNFPESGTVFFHASAAHETKPLADHYALFECKMSQKAARTADWQVSRTEDTLCQVFRTKAPISKPQEFYHEVEVFKCQRMAKILLGSGRIYMLSSDNWLIGPFTIKNEHFVPTDRMMRWKDGGSGLIESGDNGFTFACSRLLGVGFSFPSTIQEATKRMLKLVSKKGRCEFLSRLRISELTTELADPEFADDYSWLVGDFSNLLSLLRDSLDASDDLTNQLLSNTEIANLLEARWRASHSEKVGPEEAKLKKKSEALVQATKKHEELLKSVATLSAEEAKLDKIVSGQRLIAANAFNDEITRLASNPSQLAIFASLFSKSHPSGKSDSSSSSWLKVSNFEEASAGNGGEAIDIVKTLLAIGLSQRSAYDIATAAVAAFNVGQVVCLKSHLAAIIAEAIFSGIGHQSHWTHEVSAGLLDPLPPLAETHSTKSALLFHGANRSDYNLVIANFRSELLRQLLVGSIPTIDAVFTLDSVDGLVVDQPLPIGPCIGAEFIQFADCPTAQNSTIKPIKLVGKELVAPMGKDEFEELFEGVLDKLNVLKDPFLVLMARRYCGSLKAIDSQDSRVKALFLKFWLLPRMNSDEIVRLLKSVTALCESDAQLKSYLQKFGDE